MNLAIPFPEFMPVIGRAQINVFLFDSTPETFYPNIILASASAIHADTDMMLLQASIQSSLVY